MWQDKAADKIEDMVGKVKEKIDEDKAVEVVTRIGEKLEGAAERVGEKLEGAAAKVKDHLHHDEQTGTPAR